MKVTLKLEAREQKTPGNIPQLKDPYYLGNVILGGCLLGKNFKKKFFSLFRFGGEEVPL